MQIKLPIVISVLLVVAVVAFFAGKSNTYEASAEQGDSVGQGPVVDTPRPEDRVASDDRPYVPQKTFSAAITKSQQPATVDSNYESLWASFSEPERQLVSDFDGRYFNALQFYSPEQHNWMTQRGYPTPDDILAADQLSLSELQELADDGNVVAMNLLADRALNEMVRLREEYAAEGIDPYEDPEFFKYSTLMSRYMRMAGAAGSPFSGYLKAREMFELGGINNTSPDALQEAVEVSLLGLAFAASMGDRYAKTRADWLASNAGVDADIFNHYKSYDSFFKSMIGTNCNLPADKMPDVDP